jgi:glutamyl-tRNA synthetase
VAEDIRKAIFKSALINAIQHNGKADKKAVINRVLAENSNLRSRLKEVLEVIDSVISEVNSMSVESQKKALEQLEGLKDVINKGREEREKKLPEIKVREGVVTRFAPNPDGPLHLGNARAAIISFEYAKMYSGKFILRFDDTDPKLKKPIREAYEWIKRDLKWLGITWDEEHYASGRMEIYYKVAEEMINRGLLYVDECSQKEFKEKGKARACVHRNRGVEDNLRIFKKMVEGEIEEGKAVIRMKTPLDLEDPSQIDWVAMRIINTRDDSKRHPITGDKYFLWPTYNFASAIDDHLMGVTHVFRAKEHMVNTLKQKFIYEKMGWEFPEVIHFGRLSLEGFMMSKSKIRAKIEKGFEIDDPRLATLAALRRRGILPDTVKEVILDVGVKGVDAKISFDNIASINRKKLDKTAKRLMGVIVNDEKGKIVKLKVKGIERDIVAKIPYNPSNLSMGQREIIVKEGDEIYLNSEDVKDGEKVRLMELANFEVSNGNLIFISKGIEEARKMKLKIIQWVKASESVGINVIRAYGIEELKVEKGFAEKAVTELKEGDIIQFVRYGFCRLDLKGEGNTLGFIYSHQ